MSETRFYDPRSFFQSEDPRLYRKLEQSAPALETGPEASKAQERRLWQYLNGDHIDDDACTKRWKAKVRARIKAERAVKKETGARRLDLPGTTYRGDRTAIGRSGEPIKFFRGARQKAGHR